MLSTALVKHVLCLLVLVGGLTVSAASWAADPAPEAFYGHFTGTGVTQTPDLSYFGFENRDLDVRIGPDEKGFFVEWTTVIRSLGDKEVTRRNARIAFEPSGRPGIFVARDAAATVKDGLSWATMANSTLTIRVLSILDNGTYEVQTYDRSLTDDGMFLFFRSDRDGQVIRFVTARLAKQAE